MPKSKPYIVFLGFVFAFWSLSVLFNKFRALDTLKEVKSSCNQIIRKLETDFETIGNSRIESAASVKSSILLGKILNTNFSYGVEDDYLCVYSYKLPEDLNLWVRFDPQSTSAEPLYNDSQMSEPYYTNGFYPLVVQMQGSHFGENESDDKNNEILWHQP